MTCVILTMMNLCARLDHTGAKSGLQILSGRMVPSRAQVLQFCSLKMLIYILAVPFLFYESLY